MRPSPLAGGRSLRRALQVNASVSQAWHRLRTTPIMANEEWQKRVPKGNPLAIAEVELSREGELRGHPNISEPQSYEFIWRAAMGVRWSDQYRALVPYEVRGSRPPGGSSKSRTR